MDKYFLMNLKNKISLPFQFLRELINKLIRKVWKIILQALRTK